MGHLQVWVYFNLFKVKIQVPFASGGQGLFLKKPPLSVKHPQKLFIN
jgi:hypothetical protein